MKAGDLGELALRNLREAVLRSSLTTLGVAVGVASLVAMAFSRYRTAGAGDEAAFEFGIVRHRNRDAAKKSAVAAASAGRKFSGKKFATAR